MPLLYRTPNGKARVITNPAGGEMMYAATMYDAATNMPTGTTFPFLNLADAKAKADELAAQ